MEAVCVSETSESTTWGYSSENQHQKIYWGLIVFVVYLTSLSVAQTIQRRWKDDKGMMNWKGCGRKRAWLNLRCCYPGIYLERMRNSQKTCQESRSPNRDLKRGPLQYEAGVLTTTFGGFIFTDLLCRPTNNYCNIQWSVAVINRYFNTTGAGIVSNYRLDDRDSIPSTVKEFYINSGSRPALRSTQLPIQWVPGVHSRG
jgi:hypothetical protein